jgi:hypothetical protein
MCLAPRPGYSVLAAVIEKPPRRVDAGESWIMHGKRRRIRSQASTLLPTPVALDHEFLICLAGGRRAGNDLVIAAGDQHMPIRVAVL